MDVILDSNLYYRDPKLRGTQFAELFAYLRRTKSQLVVPQLVLDEVLARYSERLRNADERLRTAWADLGKVRQSKAGSYPTIDVQAEVRQLEDSIRNVPSVATLVYSDLTRIDLREVIRRGVHRIRPASKDGEELRDVVLWLLVLCYAEQSKRDVAFISDDSGFRSDDGDGLHAALLSDCQEMDVEISFYREINQFIAAHSLSRSPVKAEWLDKYLRQDELCNEAKKQSLRFGMNFGRVQGVEISGIAFRSGEKFKLVKNAIYVEAKYEGSGILNMNQSFNQVTIMSPASKESYLPNMKASDRVLPDLYSANYVFSSGGANEWFNELYPNVFAPFQESRPFNFVLAVSVRVEDEKLIAWQVDDFQATALPASSIITAIGR